MKYETGFRTSKTVIEQLEELQMNYHVSRAEIVRNALLELREDLQTKDHHVQFRFDDVMSNTIEELKQIFPRLNQSEIYELAIRYFYKKRGI